MILHKKSDEPDTNILDKVNSYISILYNSFQYKSQNEFTKKDEVEYINKMRSEKNPYQFEKDDSVRLILISNPLNKKL